MVHLGREPLRRPSHAPRRGRGRVPATTTPGSSACRSATPLAAAALVTARPDARRRPRPVRHDGGADRWWIGVLGGGFDSVVNERAARMRWPRGPMRYNLAVAARAAGLPPHPVRRHRRRRAHRRPTRCSSRSPTGRPSAAVCGSRRDASYDDGLLDVVILHRVSRRSSSGSFPAVFKGTHVSHPRCRSCAAAGPARGARHRHPGRRGAVRAAAARPRGRPRGAHRRDIAWAPWRREEPRRSSSAVRSRRSGFPLDPSRSRRARRSRPATGVLVAAPTGAGKTVVGEFAVHLAMATGRKAFYTTPIKALSNQKYADLVRRHGAGTSACSPATRRSTARRPIVVMTTEVLRNMMYAGFAHPRRARVRRHGRGPLPRRPVPRSGVGGGHHPPPAGGPAGLAVGDGVERGGVRRLAGRGARRRVGGRLRAPAGAPVAAHDGRERRCTTSSSTRRRPVQRTGRRRRRAARRGADPSEPRLLQVIANLSRRTQDNDGSPRVAAAARSRRRSAAAAAVAPLGRWRAAAAGPAGARPAPRSWNVSSATALLPAITFIFSRVGCEAAVGQLLAAGRPAGPRRGGRADPADRRGAGRPASPTRTSACSATGTSSTGSRAGIAAHHAGMLPTFREVVEELFTAGRIRAVFATETLALGINMPARTRGAREAGQVQRRGPRRRHAGGVHPAHRAGRPARHRHRGARRRPVDTAARPAGGGRARVDADLPAAVQLPARPTTWPSTSSPSSAATGPARCWRRPSPSSRPTGPWSGFVTTIRRNQEALAGYAEAMQLRPRRLRRVRRHPRRDRPASRRTPSSVGRPASAGGGRGRASRSCASATSSGSRPGRRAGLRGRRRRPTRAAAARRRRRRWSPRTAAAPAHRSSTSRRRSSRSPRSRCRSTSTPSARSRAATSPPSLRIAVPHEPAAAAPGAARSTRRRVRAGRSGCAGSCGRTRATSAPTARSTPAGPSAGGASSARPTGCSARSTGRTNSVARTFDRICDLLEERGYLGRRRHRGHRRGERLRRLYTEKDLLAAECLRHGVWERLDAAGLAAAVSTLVHEPRREEAEVSSADAERARSRAGARPHGPALVRDRGPRDRARAAHHQRRPTAAWRGWCTAGRRAAARRRAARQRHRRR